MAVSTGEILNFIHATEYNKLTANDLKSGGKHYNDIIFVAQEKKIITHGVEYVCQSADELAFFNTVTTADSSVNAVANTDNKTITFDNGSGIKAVLDADGHIHFDHTNTITAVNAYQGSNTAVTVSGTTQDVSVISGVKYDANGHITGVQVQKLSLKNSDTHYEAKAIIGATATATTNAASSNGSTYINIIENNAVRSSHLIKGVTNVTVASDASGTITITGPTLTGYAPKASPALTGTPTAPTATAGTNSTQIATTAYVKTEINNVLAASDAMQYKGTLGTGGTITALPNNHSKGDTYKIITAGTYAGVNCEVGDMIICLNDGTTAKNDDWTVIQTNIDGAVTGPASSVTDRIAVFNGTTGKIIKDSGYTIATSVPANAKFTDTTYVAATASALGLVKSSTTGTTANRNYNVEVNSDGTMKVNVPWTDTNTTYNQATASALGLIKIGYTATNKNYPLELDANGKAYVNVPWTQPTLADLSGISAINGSTGTASYLTVNNATKSGTTAALKVDAKVVDTSVNIFNGSTGLATAKAVKECFTWIEYN